MPKATRPTYAELDALATELRHALAEAEKARNAADARVKESREHFADLKKRLQEAETEVARLTGYIQRVHEDEIVSDGLIEIEDAQGRRMVPKRVPPKLGCQNATDTYVVTGSGSGSYGRKPTHWTSY